jgi:hypothetical protein
VRTMPAGLEALAWLPVDAAAGPADMPAATAAMAATAVTVASRLALLVARYWSRIDDLADWNRGDLACGEVKACLSQGVGDAQRAPRVGRPMAGTGLRTGGNADVTRVRASRCFGGNHHAPGCNRLLTVNALLASRASRKFQITDMTCVTE